MEWLMDQFDIVMVLVITNVVLTAVSKILDQVKDKTVGDGDNKAAGFLATWLPKLQAMIDWFSANRKH